MSKRSRALASVSLVGVVLALTLVACSVVGASPPAIIGTGPLVTVTTRGGECVDGPCGSTIVIERDGTVHSAAKPPNELGTVPADLLTALDAAIKTTDFDAVRSVAFDGECPTTYDGQEVIYEFGAPGGVERVASCETRIDPAHPVFAAVTVALAAVNIPAP
jgi:hypothetical protein